MNSIRPLIAGNWKMNGLEASLGEARALAQALEARPAAARVAICPPATLLSRLAGIMAGMPVEIGAQDCHALASGAHTGDISAEMLADAGARLVILGHSERRADHQESDALVARKAEAAIRAGLEPIVCVGEPLAERREGQAVATVERQLRASLPASLKGQAFAVAYEPIWAIGTGLTPSIAEIEAVHGAIRAVLIAGLAEAGVRAPILYGGSVKPDNAGEILRARDVGGALVGGASLKAKDLLAIVRAA